MAELVPLGVRVNVAGVDGGGLRAQGIGPLTA